MRRHAVASALALVCAALAILLWRLMVLEPALGIEPAIADAPIGSAPSDPQVSPASAIVAGADAMARPLFAATRRPYQPPPPKPAIATAVPAVAATPPPRLTLVGITALGDERHAMVLVNTEPAARLLAEGQLVDGWTLTEIRVDRIVLSRGESRQEVAFPAAAAVSPAVKRAPVAAMPAPRSPASGPPMMSVRK